MVDAGFGDDEGIMEAQRLKLKAERLKAKRLDNTTAPMLTQRAERYLDVDS